MNSTILSWVITVGILIILFISFKTYKMKFSNDNTLGIIISKEKYTIKNNYFIENVGKTIKKDDVIINGINEHLFIFESTKHNFLERIEPIINGYIEINDNNVIVIYKKPFILIIIIAIMLLFLGIIKENILLMLILLIIYGGIALILIILKLKSIKLDIDYFINYGK
jgi:hypothetical protein